MEGFLVFLGADSPIVIFGEATRHEGVFTMRYSEAGEAFIVDVPHGQVVAFVQGRTPAASKAALAMCGDIEPLLIPHAKIDELDAGPQPQPD